MKHEIEELQKIKIENANKSQEAISKIALLTEKNSKLMSERNSFRGEATEAKYKLEHQLLSSTTEAQLKDETIRSVTG